MMRFLRRLFAAFSGCKPDAACADLPDLVGGEEPLTRYIFVTGKFSVQKRIAKKGAFMPEFYNGQYETSICRTVGLREESIWSIGNSARQDGATVKARADFNATNVAAIKLDIKAAPDSYPQHAVIVGWSAEKHEQMMAATELANASSLVMPPPQPTSTSST